MISVSVCQKCRKKVNDSGTDFWSDGEVYLKVLLKDKNLLCIIPGDHVRMGPKSKVPDGCPYKFEHAVAVARKDK